MLFAHCKPAKQWIRSLIPSGAYLGLAIGRSLSQTRTKSLLTQLLENKAIAGPLFTLMLDSGQHGTFSVGGLPANVSHEDHTEGFESKLPWNGLHQEIERDERADKHVLEQSLVGVRNDWKWLKLHDDEGWWKIRMNGIWVNGVKVSSNQPVVLDVCAFPISAGSLVSQLTFIMI